MRSIAKVAPFLAALLCAFALIPPAGAAGPAALKPVNVADRHFGVAEAFRTQQTNLAYDAGVKWSRITMSWPQLDPGYWNGEWYLPFSYLDAQIMHDVDLVGMLAGTPKQYASDPLQGPQSVPVGL